MNNKELKKEITDERTGISYTLVGDYYLPNLVLEPEEKITLNKYGRLRLNYLKEHQKAEYTILFMNGELNRHLKEIQEIAQKRVSELVKELKAKSDLTEDMKNSNPLYWVGTMNTIKNQAEYGKSVIKNLSKKLVIEYGRGYGERNIFRMLKFYDYFPDFEILSTLSAKL